MSKMNMNHLSFVNGTISIFLPLTVFIMITASCERDKIPTSPFFSATDHIIGSSGETLRLTVQHYDIYYSLSADTNKVNQADPNCFLVDNAEMKLMAKYLSDTTYFNWEFITAVTPYPQEDCVLFAYLSNIEEYMCTLGSGKKASNTLQRIIEPLSGDGRIVLDNLVTTLMNEDGT